MKNLMYAIPFLFLAVAVNAKPPAAPAKTSFKCDLPALKKSYASALTFHSSVSKSDWLAVGPDSARFFSMIGMKKTKAVKFSSLMNSKSCVGQLTQQTTYGDTEKKNLSFSVTNACQEKWVKNFRFSPVPIENYGSMESGYTQHWGMIYICTDGKKLFHCDEPNAEMESCLKKL